MLSYILLSSLVAVFISYFILRRRGATKPVAYSYSPLPKDGNFHVRLLTLCPGPPGSPIRFDLTPKNLTNATPFEALSYVWGDASVTKQAHLCGKPFNVTTNLHSALRHLRYPDRPRTLWVDAICINQYDDDEKQSQVATMPKIYAAASNVIVWLGEADSSEEEVFDKLQKWQEEDEGLDCRPPVFSARINATLGKEVTRERYDASIHSSKEVLYFDDLETALTHWAEDSNESRHGDKINASPFRGEDRPTLSESEASALKRIFTDRPYWSRLWVVQEVVYASRATIVCGNREIPWEIIQSISRRFQFGGANKPSFPSGIIEPAQEMDQWREAKSGEHAWLTEQQTLLRVVSGLSRKKCTDPRDRIFASVNLLSTPKPILAPSYTLSVSEVYRQATVAMIRDTKSLNCICAARPRECDNERPQRRTGLVEREYVPSWVPDWDSEPLKESMVNLQYATSRYSASGGVPIDEHEVFSEIPSGLWVSAILCGKIWSTSPLGTARCFGRVTALRGVVETLQERPVAYIIGGEDMIRAIWRTLVKDCIWVKDSTWRLREEDLLRFDAIFNSMFGPFNVSSSSKEDKTAPKDKYWEDVFLEWLFKSWSDWTFCSTEDGVFVLAYGDVQEGDVVAVVRGADVPLLLRYHGDAFQGKPLPKGTEGFFSVVGPAYAHGLMDGQVLKIYGRDEVQWRKTAVVLI